MKTWLSESITRAEAIAWALLVPALCVVVVSGWLTSPCSRRATAQLSAVSLRWCMLGLCLLSTFGCAADAASLAAYVAPAPQAAGEITSIRLLQWGNGHAASQWSRDSVEITPTRTTSDRASGRAARTCTESRTSPYEWPRLCQLIHESRLFTARGETVLERGSHALKAEVTVTYADGTQSIVRHEFFYADAQPPFWTVVRVIEGSVLGALPLAEVPESR